MVQCLELYYRQGRSQKDIATALGVSAADRLAPAQARVRRGARSASSSTCRGASSWRRRWSSGSGCATPSWSRPAAAATSRKSWGRRRRPTSRRSPPTACAWGSRAASRSIRRSAQLRERRFRDLALYPAVRREHAQARRPVPQHAGGDDGGQVPAPRDAPTPCPCSTWCRCARSSASAGACCATRRSAGSSRPRRTVDIALVGIGLIGEQTPGFCALAESYGVSVKRLRQLGVVGEINYQPFDARGPDRRPTGAARAHAAGALGGGRAARRPSRAATTATCRGRGRPRQARGGPRRAARRAS